MRNAEDVFVGVSVGDFLECGGVSVMHFCLKATASNEEVRKWERLILEINKMKIELLRSLQSFRNKTFLHI